MLDLHDIVSAYNLAHGTRYIGVYHNKQSTGFAKGMFEHRLIMTTIDGDVLVRVSSISDRASIEKTKKDMIMELTTKIMRKDYVDESRVSD